MPATSLNVWFATLVFGANPLWPADEPGLPPSALSDPSRMPDDPEFAPGADAILGCAGQWPLYSFTPECAAAVPSRDRALGTGMHVDRAWLWTTGHPSVSIAILDGEISLTDPELVTRFALNGGELPAPAVDTSTVHDTNGDGAFTVLDFTNVRTSTEAPTVDRIVDRRLVARADGGDVNGNGLLDPADLIAIFANDGDDDANGLADDLCGFDFVSRSPPGATFGDEPATSFARAAAAVANNGIGGAGVCPSCTIVPIAVGIANRTRADTLADAIVYAALSGASVIVSRLAFLEDTTELRDAIRWARSLGIDVVAASGRTSRTSSSGPWPEDQVLLVSALRPNALDLSQATSFLGADWAGASGAGTGVAAPSSAGTEGAALVAGALGLLRSAALGAGSHRSMPLDPVLAAGELPSLLQSTADDVTNDHDVDAAIGWDLRTGHGRPNVRRALDELLSNRIPSMAKFVEPAPGSVLDPTPGEDLAVGFELHNRRHGRASYSFELAVGAEPRSEDFRVVGTGAIQRGSPFRVTERISLVGLFQDPTASAKTPGDFILTARIVTSAQVGDEVVRGELRTSWTVHRDLEVLPAFPRALPGGVLAGPRIVDLDGDGAKEAVVATGSGLVFAVGANGLDRPGFPVRVESGVASSPALVRLAEGLGVAVLSANGVLHLFDPLGREQPGFPVQPPVDENRLARGTTQAPVAADLDLDGKAELVVVSPDGRLDIFTLDGRPFAEPWSIDEDAGSPAVGDLDGDGWPEIVVATRGAAPGVYRITPRERRDAERIHRLEAPELVDEDELRGFFGASPVLANVDTFPGLEVILVTPGQAPLVISGDGRKLNLDASSSSGGSYSIGFEPVVADFDGDETLDLFFGVASRSGLSGMGPPERARFGLSALSLQDGRALAGFPMGTWQAVLRDASVADLDGDGRQDLVFGDGAALRALSADGQSLPHFPKPLGGPIAGAPAVGDLDGDGALDVAVARRDGLLFVFRNRGREDGAVVWDGARHDRQNTGNVETPVAAPLEPVTGGACTCRGERGPSSRSAPALDLLVALFFFLRGCSRRESAVHHR